MDILLSFQKRLDELEHYLKAATINYHEIAGRMKEVKTWIEDVEKLKAEELKKGIDELAEKPCEEEEEERSGLCAPCGDCGQ